MFASGVRWWMRAWISSISSGAEKPLAMRESITTSRTSVSSRFSCSSRVSLSGSRGPGPIKNRFCEPHNGMASVPSVGMARSQPKIIVRSSPCVPVARGAMAGVMAAVKSSFPVSLRRMRVAMVMRKVPVSTGPHVTRSTGDGGLREHCSLLFPTESLATPLRGLIAFPATRIIPMAGPRRAFWGKACSPAASPHP